MSKKLLYRSKDRTVAIIDGNGEVIRQYRNLAGSTLDRVMWLFNTADYTNTIISNDGSVWVSVMGGAL